MSEFKSKDVRSHAEVCGDLSQLQARYGPNAPNPNQDALEVRSIIAALEQFMECVRYLNTRRSGTSLALTSEAAVQDAVFLMLRPWIPDLVAETPTDRIASRYTIKDFRSARARTIIEAKIVRDKEHGRSITKELHDDIETYRSDLACENIVFFLYDPDVFVPDRAALKRQIEIDRTYGGRSVSCFIVIAP